MLTFVCGRCRLQEEEAGGEMTEAQLRELKDMFELVDMDNSGAIDEEELISLLRRLGHDIDEGQLDVRLLALSL